MVTRHPRPRAGRPRERRKPERRREPETEARCGSGSPREGSSRGEAPMEISGRPGVFIYNPVQSAGSGGGGMTADALRAFIDAGATNRQIGQVASADGRAEVLRVISRLPVSQEGREKLAAIALGGEMKKEKEESKTEKFAADSKNMGEGFGCTKGL